MGAIDALPLQPENTMQRCLLRLLMAFLLYCSASHAQWPAQKTPPPPLLVYTDIVSGPNEGGENNQGIYLSLFGKNWGKGGLGSDLKVFIGGVEVDNYRSLGNARGRPDMQQMTVQIGALGKPRPGVALAIKVVRNGAESNGNLTFTVNPGRILFADNVNGNDLSAVPGDIAHPYRHVQNSHPGAGAWAAVQAGDVIVMRGKGLPWLDHGRQGYFLRISDKSGTPPTGAANSGPIGLMAYPGEDVFIDQPYQAEPQQAPSKGAISAVNAQEHPGLGQWITISNLRIEAGGPDGVINLQVLGSHWRIVNNELTAASAVANSHAKAGGIAGNGFGEIWLGNHIHDIYCGPENSGPLQHHGIYIDGDGEYEIAYNVIEKIPGGNGFQTYVDGTNGSQNTGHIHFHHNLIRATGKHGINLADGSKDGIVIVNNLIAETRYAGLRFNSTELHLARIYHNTLYHTNTAHHPKYAAIMNDWHLDGHALDLQNNLIVPSPGTDYAGGTVGFALKVGTIERNFWFAGNGTTRLDQSAQSGPLQFAVDGKDFHVRPGSWSIDAGSAAVAGVVSDDYDLTTARPQGLGFDIGAYELAQ